MGSSSNNIFSFFNINLERDFDLVVGSFHPSKPPKIVRAEVNEFIASGQAGTLSMIQDNRQALSSSIFTRPNEDSVCDPSNGKKHPII